VSLPFSGFKTSRARNESAAVGWAFINTAVRTSNPTIITIVINSACFYEKEVMHK
jgi:hypothetical protein